VRLLVDILIGRNNVKFVHLVEVFSFHIEDCSDCILLFFSFHWPRLDPILSPLPMVLFDHMHTLITSLSTLRQFLQHGALEHHSESAAVHSVIEYQN
jgi:hypothetical protein